MWQFSVKMTDKNVLIIDKTYYFPYIGTQQRNGFPARNDQHWDEPYSELSYKIEIAHETLK
jgi:hypothetical protein